MTIEQHWQLAITPLSPVHMGTGRDYEPTGYIIDGEALFEFDGLSALQVLPEKEQLQLSAILDGPPRQEMLRNVQSFYYRNREQLIGASRHQVQVNPTVEGFYQERVGKVVQHETGGGKVQNRLEIERTAWNPTTGEAILPGSGLKGAMRTALLDSRNQGRPLPAELRQGSGTNGKLQQRLFEGSFHTDPLRLVRLGDAALRDPASFATRVQFAVNRKKQPVQRGGTLVQSQAEQKNLYQLLECLPPFQARAFEGSLSLQSTGGVQSMAWPKIQFELAGIIAACNAFYRPILENETALLRRRGFLDDTWAERLDGLLAGPIGRSLDVGKAFLLRVGRHSGAESVTLNGLRSIRILRGKGEKPENLSEAKTLWLASHERQAQRDLQPFGWLLVEPYREPGELPDWPQSGSDTRIAEWRSAVSRRVAEARARRRQFLEAEAERRREENARQQAAEAEEARLAVLSPEERKLELLRSLLQRDRQANRKEAGGELANNLVALLKEAESDWQGPLCAELADIAQEIYAFIGWPASKKKQQRQAQIAAVRTKSGA
jgi:CRISPR-associated protein Csm5